MAKSCGFGIGFLLALVAFCSLAAALGRRADAGDGAKIDGGEIFKRECSDCHGGDGKGRMINQPDFTSLDWHKSVRDERLFNRIKWGKEPMPFYAGALSDDEIRALVGHIRSIVSMPENVTCSSCHQKQAGGERGF